MIIVVKPEQLTEANAWFREHLNPDGSDNFDQPLLDEATGVITGYWASVNLTPEQKAKVTARFIGYNSVNATRDLGTVKSVDTKTDVPVKLGLEYKTLKPEQVLSTLKARCSTEADVIDTKPIDTKPSEVTK